jgi:hypothetical protein
MPLKILWKVWTFIQRQSAQDRAASTHEFEILCYRFNFQFFCFKLDH